MSDVVGWQCRDCEAIGDNPGEAVAHLTDGEANPEHTVDFIDADGMVQASSHLSTDGKIISVEADMSEVTITEPETNPDIAELSEVDQAHLRYIQAVMDEQGPDASILPCPNCKGQGWRHAVLRQPETIEVCPTCDGFGDVATGSSVPGNTQISCVDCTGKGYKIVARVAQLPVHSDGPAPMLGKPTPPPGYVWTADGSELIKVG